MTLWNAERDRLWIVVLQGGDVAVPHRTFMIGPRSQVEQARVGLFGIFKGNPKKTNGIRLYTFAKDALFRGDDCKSLGC